ncbi:MAG TPA: alkaline phosphatase family protein [Verrucomicrobiae bacterium]|nr:alkaline phosphatase family protein [Verrucomicrobiae bacterium]
MRAVLRFFLGTALLLSGWPLGAQTHIVHISVDGLGAAYLLPYLTHAPAQFPNFVRLRSEGAATFNARCDYFSSDTIPNHTTMLTGRPVSQPAGFPNTVHHGYLLNNPNPSDTFHNSGNPAVPYKSSSFDVAHDRGLKTALYVNKIRLNICDLSYDAMNGALDLIAPDYGRDKIDIAVVNDGPSISLVIDPLLQDLNSASPAHYSFIHLREPDLTGHNLNWGSPAYSNMVRAVDQELGRILAAVNQNPALLNRTTLILTADHGGGGESPNQHSDPSHLRNYTIPFFLWGPGIPPGVDLYSLFVNRNDPGTNRTDYALVPQPIRNGDAGNLALALLGLPPVPGSFMIPILFGQHLTTAYTNGTVKVTWQDPQHRFGLKSTRSLTPPIDWQPISSGITDEAGARVYRESGATGTRFFRLQRN